MSTKEIDQGNKKFGDKIKDARKQSGYTQEELSKKFHITKSYLSRIESEKQEPKGLLRHLMEVWLDSGQLPKPAKSGNFTRISTGNTNGDITTKSIGNNQNNTATITATNCRDVNTQSIIEQAAPGNEATMEVSERERQLLMGLREYFSPAEIRALEQKIEMRRGQVDDLT